MSKSPENTLRFGLQPRTHAQEVIAEWLVEIKAVVASELAGLWAKSEWHPSFQARCLTNADEELSSLINVWKSRATRLEIQKLENPHLSLESLFAASCDTTIASTLEEGKKTIEAAENLLNTLHATDAVSPAGDGIGQSPSPQVISPGYAPSRQSFGPALSNTPISPRSIASQQKVGSPIIRLDLFFPLRQHELIAGASGPVDARVPRRAPRHEHHEAVRSPAGTQHARRDGEAASGIEWAQFWAHS